MYNPSLEQVICHNKLPMRKIRRYSNKKLIPINLPIHPTIKRNSVDEHFWIQSSRSPGKEQNCTINRNSVDKYTQQLLNVDIVINSHRTIKSRGYYCTRLQKLKSIPQFKAINSLRYIKSVNIPPIPHLQSQRVITVNDKKWQRPFFLNMRLEQARQPQKKFLMCVTGDQMKMTSTKQQVNCDDSSDEEHNIWCKDDVNLVDSILNLDSSMNQFLFLYKLRYYTQSNNLKRHESYPKQKTTISVSHVWYIIEAIAKKHNPVWIDELYT